MSERIFNFNPGPAALPLPVLEEIQAEFMDFKGTGMSILEVSHRSKEVMAMVADAEARIKRLLGMGPEFRVLFLHGGASTQFYMIPKNFLSAGDVADYVDTGMWASKAIKEAHILGHKINVVASSEDRGYCYIPKGVKCSPGAVYLHLTSNNTIRGTQWEKYPDTGGVPLVADMSSDILSRPFNPAPFGLIYAGAQKNLGPAGVAVVIIRQDMLDRVRVGLPSMVSYQTHASKDSMYNTPPVFPIYVVQLVVKWLEETMGGLEAMGRLNQQKADLIYDYLDHEDFYRPTADKDSRSQMNVTYRLPTVDLEKQFVDEALKQGLGGLKGHRSAGGVRASIYNAVPLEAVERLTSFMKEFVRTHG